MATFAIGDIHGSLKALKTIFRCGIIQQGDTIVFLGDYVDRGMNSKGVLDWLLENRLKYNFKFILGNHEIMMKAATLDNVRLLEWLHFGGSETLDSYDIGDDPEWFQKISPEHWQFIDDCLPYYQADNYIFVHAGLETGKELDEQNQHHLFWKKYETPTEYKPDLIVICGHTSRKNGEIANFGHTICIDTYAHGGMWLTALNIDTKDYIKASNSGVVELGCL